MSVVAASSEKPTPRHDHEFDAYLLRVQDRFRAVLQSGGNVLFTTDADGLFDAYLSAIPEGSERQYHNCNSCRRFFEAFGGLVAIDENGETESAIWDIDDTPDAYQASILEVLRMVRKAKVTGVFYSKLDTYGTPVTGEWTHYAVKPPSSFVFRNLIKTPYQAMAEKREDYKNVVRSLAEFSAEALDQALRVLKSESLYRSEKLLGAAEWLSDLQKIRTTGRGKAKDNMTWKAVAQAPAGFCHPRSSMIGTLLEDIIAGMDFETIKSRFDAKMHPLQYQRPQSAPTAGNIAQAEKMVEQMGLAPSLRRRFARVDEISSIWTPKNSVQTPLHYGGVFGHLTPKGKSNLGSLNLPAATMTWDKFSRTVLPEADEIEFFVPRGNGLYTALVTAADPTASPILQWDREEQRNPFSWYVYHYGSLPSDWNLQSGEYVKVTAIAYQPSAWNGGFDHHGNSITFCLDGCRDLRNNGGLALFPECLRSELHQIRATIEAFSRVGKIEDFDGGHASGIRLQKGTTWNASFRVTSKGLKSEYRLDRWD